MIGVVEELMRSTLWKECSQEISTTKEVTLWYSALVDGLDMVYDVYENAKKPSWGQERGNTLMWSSDHQHLKPN